MWTDDCFGSLFCIQNNFCDFIPEPPSGQKIKFHQQLKHGSILGCHWRKVADSAYFFYWWYWKNDRVWCEAREWFCCTWEIYCIVWIRLTEQCQWNGTPVLWWGLGRETLKWTNRRSLNSWILHCLFLCLSQDQRSMFLSLSERMNLSLLVRTWFEPILRRRNWDIDFQNFILN